MSPIRLLSSVLVLISSVRCWDETSSDSYLALSAQQKNDIIWANVMEDTTPGDWYGILEMPGIFTESMCPTLRAPGKRLRCSELT